MTKLSELSISRYKSTMNLALTSCNWTKSNSLKSLLRNMKPDILSLSSQRSYFYRMSWSIQYKRGLPAGTLWKGVLFSLSFSLISSKKYKKTEILISIWTKIASWELSRSILKHFAKVSCKKICFNTKFRCLCRSSGTS